MDKIIEKYETVDLSGSDLMRMCNDKVKICAYEDMSSYTNIDQVFDNNNATIILYETKKNFGHWVIILKNNDTLIFFDSYGLKVDEELKFTSKYSRTHEGQRVGHLHALIKQSKYKLIENRYRLQQFIYNVNTCGRWCVAKFHLRFLDEKEFIRRFTNNKYHTPDFWVTSYTMLL